MKRILIFLLVVLCGCASAPKKDIFDEANEKESEVWYKTGVLRKLLDQGDQITIAVIVESILCPSLHRGDDPEGFQSLIKALEKESRSQVEIHLLESYGKYKNFKLVDRGTISKVLEEYKFQAQGYTRDIDAAQIGEFLNATHLLITSFVADKSYGFTYWRIVEVKTGIVISSGAL